MLFDDEWLETDGRGGYAMGTAAGVPTRRYHALLVYSRKPPVDRVVLVNQVEIRLERGGEFFNRAEVVDFCHDPAPKWTLRFEDGSTIEREFRLCRKPALAVLRWRTIAVAPGARLHLRPLLTGRDHHHLHFRNPEFDFTPQQIECAVTWRPYSGIPAITAVCSGPYEHAPEWRTGVYYREDQARGFDCHEDLASPGRFIVELDSIPILAFAADEPGAWGSPDALKTAEGAWRNSARRREQLGGALDRAADSYFVRRGAGRSIIAGYPWFNDWGRDTMIALRGLGIARGERKFTRETLETWAAALDRGMIPNSFGDDGQPAYHSVDAALWFVIAAYEFIRNENGAFPAKAPGLKKLVKAILAILDRYATGTRHGIRAADDGLLSSGMPHTNLTWMDAAIDGAPVTARNGKAVEINALWINALWIGAQADPAWNALLETALDSFGKRFWIDAGFLADVVDDGARVVDTSFRPNQILAVGGLPLVLLPRGRAARVVESVERILYTPAGLRTLSPADPRYHGRYEGGPLHRDSIYHQGPAWPWLLGPFVEAWLRVRDFSDGAIEEARERFLMPWLEHLSVAGLGHVSELADGDPPHTSRGCPFQAWSLGELIRIQSLLDNPESQRTHWIQADAP